MFKSYEFVQIIRNMQKGSNIQRLHSFCSLMLASELLRARGAPRYFCLQVNVCVRDKTRSCGVVVTNVTAIYVVLRVTNGIMNDKCDDALGIRSAANDQ